MGEWLRLRSASPVAELLPAVRNRGSASRCGVAVNGVPLADWSLARQPLPMWAASSFLTNGAIECRMWALPTCASIRFDHRVALDGSRDSPLAQLLCNQGLNR